MIVEHWDNLAEKPKKSNPSGHTQIDGPTEIKDQEKAQENKELAKEFVETILMKGQMDKLSQYFDDDNYTQHNTKIGDGLSGLGKAFFDSKDKFIDRITFLKSDKNKYILSASPLITLKIFLN